MSKKIQLFGLILSVSAMWSSPLMANYMDECKKINKAIPDLGEGEDVGACRYIRIVDSMIAPFKPMGGDEVSAGPGGVVQPDYDEADGSKRKKKGTKGIPGQFRTFGGD